MRIPLLLAIAVAAPLGCKEEAPPAPSPPAATTPAAPTAPASPPTTPPSTTVPTAPAAAAQDGGAATRPASCEVEVRGVVKRPASSVKAPNPITFIAIGDCLDPSAKVLGRGGTTFTTKPTEGMFFLEVFAPWGSDLSLCAAVEPAPGKPSTLYGKVDRPMHAAATGEVTFNDLVVELEPGPPKKFVDPRFAH